MPRLRGLKLYAILSDQTYIGWNHYAPSKGIETSASTRQQDSLDCWNHYAPSKGIETHVDPDW